MEPEIACELPEALVRRVVGRRIRRRLMWRGIVLFVLIAMLAGLSALGGGTGGAIILLLFCGVLALVYVWTYFRMVRHGTAALRKLAHRRFTYRLSDEQVEIVNAFGETRLTWGTIERVVRDREALLLYFTKYQYFIVPLAAVREEQRAFIEGKVAQAGGKEGRHAWNGAK